MPFDKMAADDNPGSLDIWASICGDELLELPYDERLGLRFLRPQRDWFYANGNSRFTLSNTLHFLPHQQQLHSKFHGLHGLPPVSLEQHAVFRRKRAESYYGGIPFNGVRLHGLPSDHQVD
jgi:hypothetical protein